MRKKIRVDWWLIAPAIVLVMLSLTVLSSINLHFFRSQLIAFIISFATFLFLSQVSTNILKLLKLPIYIVSILLLGIVLLVGLESRGAVRWINIFGVSVQFSELLKPFLLVSFAAFIADRQSQTLKSFFITIGYLIPVFILIYLQPDLGSALVYAMVAFLAMFIIGFPLWWFLIALFPLVLSLPVLWAVLHDYQRQRILTFFSPHTDPLGTSYNVIQAVIAVGSGMFTGKGLGEGTQSGLRFLPERQTDFIFATLSEGLGFTGALLIITTFAVLIYRIYIIFAHTEDLFEKIYSAGCFFFFIIQFFFNIGMNLGILPIVGITLPFVSFGGSSLLTSFILLGILSSISVSGKHKHVLEIK